MIVGDAHKKAKRPDINTVVESIFALDKPVDCDAWEDTKLNYDEVNMQKEHVTLFRRRFHLVTTHGQDCRVPNVTILKNFLDDFEIACSRCQQLATATVLSICQQELKDGRG